MLFGRGKGLNPDGSENRLPFIGPSWRGCIRHGYDGGEVLGNRPWAGFFIKEMRRRISKTSKIA
jgi:hypothetical protein